MEGQPLGSLPADPREFGKFGDQLLDRAHRSEWRGKGQRRDLPHLGLEHFGRSPLGLGHGSEDQIAQELGVMILEDRRIDSNRPDGAPAVSGDFDHAAAGGGLDGATGQFALQLLQASLDLLTKLKELLKICHAIG
jgi:hypothetical protein